MNLEQQLNPEQLEAVVHGEGPQLVLAGAGSGKTRVITHRIAWLIGQRRVEPYRIAAVTFTNKAAREMADRVERLLGRSAEVFVGTFHRFSLRLLRRYGDRVGLRPGFAILDTAEQLAVAKRALEAEKVETSVFPPRAALSRISSLKNRLVGAGDYRQEASGHWEERLARVYARYQRLLREDNAVDFDDMLSLSVRLLDEEQELRERFRKRLRYLLVDEFQDTNIAQLRLIELINDKQGNLTAVGDEDQSIYRWRGAELSNILRFEDFFPGATVRKLERNYRSTQTILDASGALVANNRERRGKRLWTEAGAGEPIRLFLGEDENDEARWIVERIRSLAGEHAASDFAVLVRTNAQTRAIEDELLRWRVPYVLIAGTRFYERAEIKDLVAYLRLVRNPEENAAFRRVVNVPARGIGKATLDRLSDEAEEMGRSLWYVLVHGRLGRVSTRAANSLGKFRSLIEELRALASENDLPRLIAAILEKTAYSATLTGDDDASRQENVRELISAAQQFAEDLGALGCPALLAKSPAALVEAMVEMPPAARSEGAEESAAEMLEVPADEDPLTSFLDYVSLVADTDGLRSDAGVSIMTLHSAKGLEFPVVFVAGLEDGLLPHFNSDDEDEIEEERRLLYVGMTRARQRLLLTSCRRRRIAGRYQDQLASPFLSEIPQELLEVEGEDDRRYQRTRSLVTFFSLPEPPSVSGAQRFSREPGGRPAASDGSVRGGRSTHSALGVPSAGGSSSVPDRVGTPSTRSRFDVPLPAALDERVTAGTAVIHPLLGRGVVLDVDGEGDNAKLTVYFDRAGRRRLIAKYAGLSLA